MKIAIVSNLNGIGLQRDAELLSGFLSRIGHEVTTYQWDVILSEDEKADLAIFLEVIPRDKLHLAEKRWLVANPEWLKPEFLQLAKTWMNRVIVKTKEAERVLSPHFPGRIHYTGFLARDQHDSSIKKELAFLHIGGNSSLRGTQAVLDAWKWKFRGKGLGFPLYIVSTALKGYDAEFPPENVKIFTRIDEEQLKFLQNSCLFHLYPSGTEGFGHALHEALSVQAMILVSDAPPMNEIESAYKIKAWKASTYHLADVYNVSAIDLHNAVKDMAFIGKRHWRTPFHAREEFCTENRTFEYKFKELLDSDAKKPAPAVSREFKGQICIGFLGNFEAPESTENMIKWALEEQLGHIVWKLQENKTTMAQLEFASNACDMFLWVKTPGWLQISDREMLQFLAMLRAKKITSFSMHLDKFWGIPDRETQIGVHPFWKTDHVFTADGNPESQKGFAQAGVAHYWMRPAVSEVYCHPGTPREEYRYNVAFVGARGYHREYPFRKDLIEFLEVEYGNEFKHVEGLRGHGLNDFYASARVIVGDCIFSGLANYYSDRVPETCGRGGFLLHPKVNGLLTPVATFEPQNLDDLKKKIDYYLANELERKFLQRQATYWTAMHDTWTIRLQEIFEAMKCQTQTASSPVAEKRAS